MPVETGGWVTVTEGAALLGVSRSRVLRALRWGVLSGRRERRNLWLVDGEALMVWSLGRRVGVGVAAVRSDRYVSVDGRPHVELLDRSGLTDEEIAAAVGVDARRVVRWRERGVPGLYVACVRQLSEAAGTRSRPPAGCAAG